MKMLTGLVCLLLMSSVGCGQQTSTHPVPTPPAVEQPAHEAPKPAAPAPAQQAAAQPATPDASDAIAAGEEVEAVEEKPAADTATIRLAQAVAPASPEPSSRWQLGKHYNKVMPAQPTSVGPDKVEVIEAFWYGCPHCYAADPYFENWKTKKAAYIEFIRLPITWGQVHRTHARLYYTLEALGKSNLHADVFREVQVARNPLAAVDDAETENIQAQFVKRLGVDEAAFRKAYHSFEVETKLQRAEELVRRYRLDTVPNVIINGKYIADVQSAGSPSQLISLINDLAAAEQRKN